MGDEENRVKMLGQAPAMQLSAADYASNLAGRNSDRHQLENTKINAFNADRYKSKMTQWGAGKQADATAASGKK